MINSPILSIWRIYAFLEVKSHGGCTEFVGWTYIQLWFLRWIGVRERASSNNTGCIPLLHRSQPQEFYMLFWGLCWPLVYFCARDYVVILSYSSLYHHWFGLSTVPPASRYVPAVIYWLGSQRAVLLLTLGWVLAVSGLFGKGLKVLQIDLAAFQLVSLQSALCKKFA